MKKVLIGISVLAVMIILYNLYASYRAEPNYKNYVALESKDFGSFWINKEQGLYGFISDDLLYFYEIVNGASVLRSIPKKYVVLYSEYYKK